MCYLDAMELLPSLNTLSLFCEQGMRNCFLMLACLCKGILFSAIEMSQNCTGISFRSKCRRKYHTLKKSRVIVSSALISTALVYDDVGWLLLHTGVCLFYNSLEVHNERQIASTV